MILKFLLGVDSVKDIKGYVEGIFSHKDKIIAEYADQIKGLTRAEAEAVLSTKALSNAQKQQILTNSNLILSDNGLILSKKAITAKQQEQLITSGLLTSEKMAEIAATLGLTTAESGELIATEALDASKVKLQLTEIGVIGTTQTQILAMLGLTSAEGAATGATGLLTKAILALKAAWLANPIGVILTTVVGVVGVIHLYNNSVDGMIKKNQKLIDSNKEVYDSILEEQKTLSNNADNLKEQYENYLTATKGSEEYYNAANKIAELSPELVVGYDNEGNAILANNDAIKAQIEYYKELAKEKQNAAIQEAMENLDEETESYKKLESKKESKEKQYNKSKETLDKYEKIINDVESGKVLSEEDSALYNEAIMSIEGVRGRVNDLREDISDLSDQLLTSGNSLRTYYTSLFDVVDGELTEGQKSLRKGLVNTAIEEGWSAEKFQTMDDFIDKDYIKNAAEEIINLDDNLSEEEYRNQATAIYENLVKQFVLTDEQKQAFKVAFGIDDETIENAKETRENNLSLISDKVAENKLNESTGNDILDWTKTLSNEDLQIVAELKFDENTTVESLKKLLDEAKGIVENSGLVEKFSKSQMIDAVNNMSDGFDVLADIYDDIIDGADFDFTKLDTKKFEEAFKGLEDEYTEFIETVSDSPKDISKCQDAFNKLAGAYIRNNNILENLTDENANVTAAMLKNMGIVNAEAIVLEQLALNKEKAKESTQKLAEAGAEEALSHIEVADGISIEEKALAQLTITKMLVNGQTIKTSGDIDNIIALAQAAGIAVTELEELSRIKAIFEAVNSGSALGQSYLFDGTFEQAQADLEKYNSPDYWKDKFSSIYDYESPTAADAAKKAADAYVESFEKELESLQILRDRGEINEKEYLDRLKVLYEKYFKDRKEYIDELRKYEKEYLEGMESLYSSALSGITKLLDKRIDAIEKEKDSVLESLEKEKEARLEALEIQIDAKQEVIDGIQKEIDKMQEANDERKRQIDLQKAQYNLERLQNQNTQLIYKDGQMVYQTDSASVRDAREEVADAKFEIEVAQKEKQISLLEEEIELLEKQKESVEDYYSKMIEQQEKYFDSLIKNLETQKSKWEELADIKEVAEAYSAIEQVFGDLGYTVEDVLNGSEGAFEDFKSKYLAILSDMNQNTSFQDGLAKASCVAKESFGSIINTAQEELSKMDQLGIDAGQGFIDGWDKKSEEIKESAKQTASNAVDAFAEGQHSNSPSEDYKSLAHDAVDGLVIGIEEKKQEFIDSVKALAQEGAIAFGEAFTSDDSGLKNSFDSLKLLIETISEAIGIGEDATVGSLLGAISALSNVSLGDGETGIIGQFNALKTAVDEASSSISGGGSMAADGGGLATGANGGATTPDMSGGEGSGLLSAIEEIGTTTDETLGMAGEESEGEGVIGRFGALKTAIDEVTKTIGTGEEDEEELSLISSLRKHYEVAEETIPGIKSLFEELLVSISACVSMLGELAAGIASLGSGGISVTPYASGTTRAKKGLSIVGEEAPELIEDTKGNLSLAATPTLLNMKGGEKVYNGNETANMLTPLDESSLPYATLMKAKSLLNTGMLHTVNNTLSKQLDGTMSAIKSSPISQNVNLSIGDIQLHGVQDVNGLANAITTKLPNMLLQTITKR